MRVLLDANFMMIPGQFGVDIFSELERVLDFKYELITLSTVKEELELLSEGSSKDARAANMGLQLIEQKDVTIVDTKKHHNVDATIINEAKKGDVIVATQDRVLQDALKELDIPIVMLKGKSHLALKGYTK